MLTDAIVVLVLLWFFGGTLYRERSFLKAATFRAQRYNDFVAAMEIEFGAFRVAEAARKHNLPLFSEPTVQRAKWAIRIGW